MWASWRLLAHVSTAIDAVRLRRSPGVPAVVGWPVLGSVKTTFVADAHRLGKAFSRRNAAGIRHFAQNKGMGT